MMKRSSWLKRTVCASLAILTVCSMAGCKGGAGDKSGDGGNNGGGKSPSGNVLSKEGIYKEAPIPLEFVSDEEYVMTVNRTEEGMTILASSYSNSATMNLSILKEYSVSPDGKLLGEIELKDSEYDDFKSRMEKDVAPADNEMENPDGVGLPNAVGSATGDNELPDLKDTDNTEDADAILDDASADPDENSDNPWVNEDAETLKDAVYPESNGYGNYEGLNYNTACIATDGKVYAIKGHSVSKTVGEEYIEENTYSACAWDKDGKLLWETKMDIPNGSEDEWYYVPCMVMGDKNIYAIVEGTDSFVVSVGLDGTSGVKKPMPSNLDFYGDCYSDGKGNLYVSNWTEKGTELVCIELDSMKKKEAIKLPSAMSTAGFSQLKFIDDETVFYCTDTGVYTYHFGDETPKMMMNYINSDINSMGFNEIFYESDSSFYALYNDSVDYKLVCSHFTRVNPEDVPDKEILEFAGMTWIDNEMRERIIKFNKSSDKYKIVIRDYNQYNTEEDYSAGITQLNNDIIAGNIPDILVTDSLKVENYVSKGLLVDIGDLIAKDEQLNKTEFMSNVFDAYKVDGKLYEVIPSFMVVTVVGKKSIVGDRTSWTMQEMLDTLQKLGPDAEAFSMMDRSSFMYYMMMFNSSDFIDRNSGKCNFNSEQFIDCLKFAKDLPEEFNYDDESYDWEGYQSQYRENRTLLMPLYINEFQYLKTEINGYMGEDVSYVGFPSNAGNGSVINKSTGFAISAKSKNVDGAWEFLRQFLLDDYQEKLDYYLPVNKAALLEKSKQATQKSFWIDEDGQKYEYDDTFYINGEEIPVEPLTQDQVNKLLDMISNIKINGDYDDDIEKIIEEESGAYYAGNKSAEDVADIIQSRVQVFINENR